MINYEKGNMILAFTVSGFTLLQKLLNVNEISIVFLSIKIIKYSSIEIIN